MFSNHRRLFTAKGWNEKRTPAKLREEKRGKVLKTSTLFLLNGQVELELRRQLVFRVQSVREVDSADSAVGMDLEEQVDKNVTSQLAVAFREQEARPARRGSISCHLFSGRAP